MLPLGYAVDHEVLEDGTKTAACGYPRGELPETKSLTRGPRPHPDALRRDVLLKIRGRIGKLTEVTAARRS